MKDNSLGMVVGKGVAWTSVGGVFSKIVGLACVFVVLRNLSVLEYGLAELVLSTLPIFSIFLLPGLNLVAIADAGNAIGRNNRSEAKGIVWNFVFLQWSFAFVAWAILFFGAEIVATLGNYGTSALLKILSFSFLISPLRSLFQIIFRIEMRFRLLSLYTVLEESIKLSFLLLFFYGMDLHLEGYILAYILTDYVGAACMLPVFLRVYRPYRTVGGSALPFLFLLKRHGKWSIITNYYNSLGQYVRIWIIQLTLGTQYVGLYGVASGLYRHVVALFPLGAVLQPILPQLMNDTERMKVAVARAFKYSLWGFVFLGISSMIAVPLIIPILFPKYAESVTLFTLLLPSLIPLSLASVLTPLFHAYQAQKDLFAAITHKTIAIVIFGFVLFPLGPIGLGLEFFLTQIVFAWSRLQSIKTRVPGGFPSFKTYFTFTSDDALMIRQFVAEGAKFFGFSSPFRQKQ